MSDLPRQFPCNDCDRNPQCTSPNECKQYSTQPTEPVPTPRWRGNDEKAAKHKAVKAPKEQTMPSRRG